MKHVNCFYDDVWMLAGAVEELRNSGVRIPQEVEETIREALLKVNFRSYVLDEFPRARDRLVAILRSLGVSGPTTGLSARDSGSVSPATPRLAPFRTDRFLTDRVLGVGLKSYPYVVDVNADGKKDLLVGDHDGFIYVYHNEGTDAAPVFGPGRRLAAVDTDQPLVVQYNPKISMADLTGTGSLDMVLGNYGGRVAFIPNRASDGTFQFAMRDVDYLRTRSGYVDVRQYAYPELVDWDGRGRFDLLVGNIHGQVILFRNVSRAGEVVFDEGEEVTGLEPLMYPYPICADWNNDGLKDLILGHRDGTIIVYLNAGDPDRPRFIRHDVVRHADGRPVNPGMLSHPFVVDFNNDGRKDLVVGNDPGQVIVYLNVGTDGEPVFDVGTLLKDPGGELITGVHPVFAVAELTGKGRRDLVVGHEEQTLRLFPDVSTDGQPEFDGFCHLEGICVNRDALAADDAEAARFWDLDGLEFSTEYLGNLAPCLVDWHNTGTLDVLVGNYTGLVYLFENTGSPGSPRFAPGVPLRVGPRLLRVAGFAVPVVCDWNNDGRKDLLVSDLLGRIHVFINEGADGDPAFSAGSLVTVHGVPVALGPRAIVEVADLDGDGRKDLLVGNRRGEVYAMINIGTDAEPAFDAVEPLRDDSAIWRGLYAGAQFATSHIVRELYDRLPVGGRPQAMNVVETACPRIVDIDNDGRCELVISQRYGRVFVYDRIPRQAGP